MASSELLHRRDNDLIAPLSSFPSPPFPPPIIFKVASDEEDGANSGRSPGRRLSDLRQSPLTRSLSHANDGLVTGVTSKEEPFVDDQTGRR